MIDARDQLHERLRREVGAEALGHTALKGAL